MNDHGLAPLNSSVRSAPLRAREAGAKSVEAETTALVEPGRRLMSSLDACLMGNIALGVHRHQSELAIIIEFE